MYTVHTIISINRETIYVIWIWSFRSQRINLIVITTIKVCTLMTSEKIKKEEEKTTIRIRRINSLWFHAFTLLTSSLTTAASNTFHWSSKIPLPSQSLYTCCQGRIQSRLDQLMNHTILWVPQMNKRLGYISEINRNLSMHVALQIKWSAVSSPLSHIKLWKL